jgi:hypothetical protein
MVIFTENMLLDLGKLFLKTQQGQNLIAKSEGINSDVKSYKASAEVLKKYVPEMQTFTTTGRVYDKQTGLPLKGIEVKPQFTLYPVIRVKRTAEELLEKKNANKGEYKFIKDNNSPNFTKTDEEGRFEIQFSIPTLPSLGNKSLVKPTIFYNEKEYAPAIQSLINGDNEIPQELPIFGLINLDLASKQSLRQIEEELASVSEKAANTALDATELLINATRRKVMGMATVIQTKLFPLAFQLMILFGIAKIEQASNNQETCPSGEVLKSIIKRRNSVVRQLNNIYSVIIANTLLAGLLLYLSTLLKQSQILISSIPIPLGAPVGVGVPYSVVAKLEDIKKQIDKLINIADNTKKALLISLVFLIISLLLILKYLKAIDGLIDKCTIEPNSGETMIELNAELLALSSLQAEQGNPVITKVNGFIMSVQVVDKSNVDDYFRRQAIAKNSQGITILKGEPSFSAGDQILIDELVFYIQQNNLKAD